MPSYTKREYLITQPKLKAKPPSLSSAHLTNYYTSNHWYHHRRPLCDLPPLAQSLSPITTTTFATIVSTPPRHHQINHHHYRNQAPPPSNQPPEHNHPWKTTSYGRSLGPPLFCRPMESCWLEGHHSHFIHLLHFD